MKIEEGKRYVTRDQRIALVSKKISDCYAYSWVSETDDDRYNITSNGAYFVSGMEHPGDLMREATAEDLNTNTNTGRLADGKPRTTKADILDAAKAAVADRGLNYGRPEDNFNRIAALWNVHLRNRYAEGAGGDTTVAIPTMDGADVAQMMVLMKVARLENTPGHKDSWIDIAGYAACGGEITGS